MIVDFSRANLDETPILLLKNASETVIGAISNAENVNFEAMYNETSTLQFTVHQKIDGVENPFYDALVGLRIVELQHIGQFTLVEPVEHKDGIQAYKECKAFSLEYEFAYKQISIPEGTYPLYSDVEGTDSIVGIILEKMPSWSVRNVAPTLLNKYRTFDTTSENALNLMRGSVQQSFECIFEFDTLNRKIDIVDANEETDELPIYLSNDNLVKELSITESAEDIRTRITVNGADDVSIRDVNPSGTNSIICLDYYMTTDNFDQALIDKYFAWKELYDSYKNTFYNLSVRYSMGIEQKLTEQAKLTDKEGELTTLESQQAVIISAIAKNAETQDALDEINELIAEKRAEMETQKQLVDSITAEQEDMFARMKEIRNTCDFESYFTKDEYKLLDRFIIDGDITDTTFVAEEVSNYSPSATDGSNLPDNTQISVDGATIEAFDGGDGMNMFDISGGTLTIGGLSGSVVTAVIDPRQNGNLTISAYLVDTTYNGEEYPKVCISVTGKHNNTVFYQESRPDKVSLLVSEGYLYMTLNASEYQKRSVAWELYEYGEHELERLSAPSYTFTLDVANFISIDAFKSFRNSLRLGRKPIVDAGGGRILHPIFTGVSYDYNDKASLSLSFGDKFSATDSKFKLVDLLDKSVSMGRAVAANRRSFGTFVESGASSWIKDFMTGSLDVSKNKLFSSSNMDVSIDGAGIRLRRWKDKNAGTYDDAQIWMNNNSIMMTSDGWSTANVAIGEIFDEKLGEEGATVWGIAAPMIVGTMIAGSKLVIEGPTAEDGTNATFRVDQNGARLFNADFAIKSGNREIIMSPELGFAMGKMEMFTLDDEGHKQIDPDKATLYADENGNLHVTGAITATSMSLNLAADRATQALSIGAISLRNDDSRNVSIMQWDGEKWVQLTQVAADSFDVTRESDGTIVRITDKRTEAVIVDRDVSQTQLGKLNQKVSDIDLYMRFDPDTGLVIGDNKQDNPMLMNLTNEKLSFNQGDTEVAYVSSRKLFIHEANVLKVLSFGLMEQDGENTHNYFDFVRTSKGLGIKWRAAD